MAKMKSLEDLFINLLKDMYYAEKQNPEGAAEDG